MGDGEEGQLEAAAWGIPGVAAGVGGLLSLVNHGETWSLVPDRDPTLFAPYVREIVDRPAHAAALGQRGAERAKRYTWGFAAARLRRLYTDLCARELVACS